MSTSEDHEGLADELDREGDEMARESDKLGQEIADARDDWTAKRNDPSVPGAPPPPAEDSDAAQDADADSASEH